MMDDLVESYAAECSIRPRTIEHYRNCCRDFERWLARSATGADFTKDTVNRYLRDREATMSLFTVHNRRIALLIMWRFGHEEGLIPEAPPIGRKIRRIRLPPITNKVISPEEVRDLLQKLERLKFFIRKGRVPTCVYWGAWIRVAWDSGLRLSDQMQLEYQPLIDGKGVLRITQQKNRHPVTIRLSASTLEALQRLHAYVPHEKLAFPAYYRDRREMSHRFIEITAQLGHRINLTVLRKSSATWVEQQLPGSAWRHLGHKSRHTTDKWYINSEHSYEGIPRPEDLGGPDHA